MISTFNQRLAILFTLTLMVICPINGQIAGGLSETTSSNWGGSGTNFISGVVVLPDGNPINSRIAITLQSQTKGEVIATTDDSGKFVFSRIPPGVYYFIFQGDADFEPVNQEVEVLQPRNSTVSLTLGLRYKPKTATKPWVINSELAGVHKKPLIFTARH